MSALALKSDEMNDLAGILRDRGYPGGIRQLAREAREWIGDCGWSNLTRGEAAALTDAEALSGVDRHFTGGLGEFLAIAGYPSR